MSPIPIDDFVSLYVLVLHKVSCTEPGYLQLFFVWDSYHFDSADAQMLLANALALMNEWLLLLEVT